MVEALPIFKFLGHYGVALTQAIYFALTFCLTFIIGRLVILPLGRRLIDRHAEIDDHARQPLRRLALAAIVLLALLLALTVAQLESLLRSVSTITAAGTLAVGYAMSNVLGNFVAGVFIYVDRPFRIGDWIEWEDGEGTVEDITLRVTRVRTFDNELLTVPNGVLTEGVITNHVANDRLRIQFTFGIGYDDDIETAISIIESEAESMDAILNHPSPTAYCTELADSYVALTAWVWIDEPNRSDFLAIRSTYIRTVKSSFDEHGIDIPYPQRSLSGAIETDGPNG